MSEGYEDDLEMYEESAQDEHKALDNEALMRPISDLEFPTDPLSVAPDVTVGEALELMVSRKIGHVLVLDKGEVVGIFAERDALMKRLFLGGDLDRPISEFMTPDPVCLTKHDAIAQALNRMVVGGYRHVPLVDADGKPEGILVMRDVVRHIVSFFPTEVMNAAPHSEHNPPDRNREGG